MRGIVLASILLLISGTSHAAGPAPAAAQPQPTGHGPAPPSSDGAGLQAGEATRIETDQKTGTVWIIVDGRKVVRIDRSGLYVTGDVDYTGELIDGGGTTDKPRAKAKP